MSETICDVRLIKTVWYLQYVVGQGGTMVNQPLHNEKWEVFCQTYSSHQRLPDRVYSNEYCKCQNDNKIDCKC